MSESLNKKLSQLLGKMDEKVLQKKINTALEMLKNGDTQDLAKKINKMDKNELIEKIDEFDKSKLGEMNINFDELKKKISSSDLDKLSELIGNQGDEVIKKIKDIIQ